MKKISLALALLFSTLSPLSAHAVTWSGFSTTFNGTSQTLRSELAGSIIAQQTFTLSPGLVVNAPNVTLTNWVVRETVSGTLDFYYQLNNPNATTVTITQFAIDGFDIGPSLDVDMRTDLTGSVQSSFASRISQNGSFPANVIIGSTARGSGVWTLNPDTSLAPIFLHTSAVDFQATGQIDFIPNTLATTGFTPAVPEPVSLVLLPLAFAALAVKVRRHI